jgi:hypothetical protein
MTREVGLVLIAGAAVALLAIAAVLLAVTPVQAPETTVSFKDQKPMDVARIGIRNAYGATEISFTGEGYLLDDLPVDLVDMDEFVALLTHSARVYALRAVATSAADLERYGLASPIARVEIHYRDGSALTLLIGNQERVSGDYYLAVDGDPSVYLIERERCSGYLLPKKAYIEDLVTPALTLSSPLSAVHNVTFSGGSLPAPVTIEAVATGDPDVVRAALSFGAATHVVRGKGTYELDQTYGVEMLGALLGITATDVVDYGLAPEQVRAFGFDRPTMRAEFDLKNGLGAPVVHFSLGVLERDGTYYLTCNDSGVIYVVPEPAFVRLEYQRLLVRWFLSPLIIDVREMRLSTAGEAFTFRITGATSADKRVTCNGAELDIDRFRTLYTLVASAAHDGALLDNALVQGDPLLTLTYVYADGGKQPDVMRLYPGDARRLYAQVNNVTELAMRETYLLRVQAALRILWTDERIETDW